jgi:hypothetical protein
MYTVWWTGFCRAWLLECQQFSCSLSIKATNSRLGWPYRFLKGTPLLVNVQPSYLYNSRTTVVCNNDGCQTRVSRVLHDSVWSCRPALFLWPSPSDLCECESKLWHPLRFQKYRSASYWLLRSRRRVLFSSKLHLQFCSRICILLEKPH